MQGAVSGAAEGRQVVHSHVCYVVTIMLAVFLVLLIIPLIKLHFETMSHGLPVAVHSPCRSFRMSAICNWRQNLSSAKLDK